MSFGVRPFTNRLATMRITTFDLDEHKQCGIEASLRRLAASPEPLEATSCHKLLQLVEHLRASGPEQELCAQIVFDKLHLRKREPPDPVRNWQMKRFMDEWRALNPDPSTWGNRLGCEMRKRFPPKPQVRVSVWVDWRDYSPLRDGLPEMHYRFQIERPGKTMTEDARARDLMEAERVICKAFSL
jgi:hypothetical protein